MTSATTTAEDSVAVSTHDRPDRQRVAAADRTWRWRLNRSLRVRGADGPLLPFNPETWTDERRQLLWQTPLEQRYSFASVARYLAPAIERQGVEITIGPYRGAPPAGFERFYGPLPPRDRLGFHYDLGFTPAMMGCERLVYYATWESTVVPPEEVEAINRHVSLLCVPCRHNAAVFAACGVRVPIKVLPHGVDPAAFPCLDRPPRDVFTFGTTLADLHQPRKGIDLLVRAFQAEFAAGEPVRLLIKRTVANRLGALDWAAVADPRITIVTGTATVEEVRDLYRLMDAFVLPSRGEGFGLCGLEAMATGLPTIATDWSGPADYLDPTDSLPLAYRLVDATEAATPAERAVGQQAEPDERHLRSLMRWLFEHPSEGAAMGRRAAARVHAGWTWDRPAAQLVADLDLLAQGISPTEPSAAGASVRVPSG